MASTKAVLQCNRALTLLSLVAESASLVWSSGTGTAVNLGQLTELPATDAEKVTEHIALLLAIQLGNVFVGPHFGLTSPLKQDFLLFLGGSVWFMNQLFEPTCCNMSQKTI